MSAVEKRITAESLKEFCQQALQKEGLRDDYAKVTAEVLTETDAFGTHTHGVKNLHNYLRKFRAGGMDLNAVPEVIAEGAGYALVDGKSAIGMVPAYQAANLAVCKAAAAGIAYTVVKNGSHFGAAGYYANLIARRGMVGIVCSNVDANMTIPGARGKVIGNNPLAYAVPRSDGTSIFLDIAMSSVASLKVIQAKKDGRSVPDTWIIGEDGKPTTDPSGYPDVGAVQPMAAHKGYGLALMVELLTSGLSGGGMMTDVPSWLFHMKEKNDVSHAFIAIDISNFMPLDTFRQRMDNVVERIHHTPRADGTDRIFFPGEMEWEQHRDAEVNGILLPSDVVESIEGLSEESGIPIPWLG